jgi:ATP-binding cassette subfamily G (WHITE) protein 2
MATKSVHYGEVSVVDDVAKIELGEVSVDSESGRQRALTFSPSHNEKSPSILTFNNISVSTRTTPKKVLINNVSGSITGGFWAIMGSSGGGKTTLLSTLALRLDPNYIDISGEIRLNGREYSKKTLKAMSSYVMQDDVLHAELTVEETLYYATQLRMADGTSSEEKESRQEEVLKLMGITHCKKTIVGNTRKKGISGGERKRLCVAIELLNHPKLLFLDEPTSGLDSSTALSVCQALKNLSDSGECTVVCTIHQPQPKIFNLFDNLILMKKGSIVYQGGAKKSVNFLIQLNMPLPPDESLADFLLDVVTPGKDDEVVDAHSALSFLHVDLSLGFDKKPFEEAGYTSWLNQYTTLLLRNFLAYSRRRDQILMNFLATSMLAFFICMGVWKNIGTGQPSVALRQPSLFFACVCQGVLGSLQSINSFPAERAIMLRERASGAYHVSSYFCAKTTVDMIAQLWPPIVFSCIVYFTVGYQPVARKFFLYTFFMILDSLCATTLASAVTCICVSVEMSTVVVSCLFEWSRLYGAYYTSPKQFELLPRMIDWKFADALSYIKYSFVGIALNELHGLELDCPAGTTCKYHNGGQIITAFGYDEYNIGGCAGVLVAFIVTYCVIAYLALRFIRY